MSSEMANSPPSSVPQQLQTASFKYAAFPTAGLQPTTNNLMTQAAIELHRARLMDYTSRLRYPASFTTHQAFNNMQAINEQNFMHTLLQKDPRRFLHHIQQHHHHHHQHEEPKPAHSYIGLIAMAILSSKERKLVLSDIYQWILDNYSYFQTRGPGWRNSIRHNLSLNDCFIKSGRSANGKGHYWAIHPANLDDFQKGDFRRRRAQRKVRKHMGLAVPDEEDDSPSPPPPPTPAVIEWQTKMLRQRLQEEEEERRNAKQLTTNDVVKVDRTTPQASKKKRLFDMESLLAPDTPKDDDEDSDVEIEIDVTDQESTTIISDEEEKVSLSRSPQNVFDKNALLT